MNEPLQLIKSLTIAPGVSGDESPVAGIIAREWTPLVDEITRSRLGSLHGLLRSTSGDSKDPPSIMVMTHMDTIGLMVSHIKDGFLYVTNIGEVDPRVLPGTPVSIHASGRTKLDGVIAMPPSNGGAMDKAIPLKSVFIDTGLYPEEVSKLVSVGDRVSFNTDPLELPGGCLSSHSLDNRASVAALTLCLQELRARQHAWNVWAVASVLEEVSFGGASTSSFQLRPRLAVVVDVTFGKAPGAEGYDAFPLDKGVTLGVGAFLHPHLYRRLRQAAEMAGIPASVEVMATETSTDADVIQLTAEGIPTAVISIPLRYMHTPVEVAAVNDIIRAGRLLAEFISTLELDFVDNPAWQ